jgi:hypothetical protein
MESLLCDIRDLHEHHVSAPHEGQYVKDWIKMINKDVVIYVKLPNTQC